MIENGRNGRKISKKKITTHTFEVCYVSAYAYNFVYRI